MENKQTKIMSNTIIIFYFLVTTMLHSQVIIDDFLVNNPNENLSGVGRTSIAVSPNGNIGIAWHDYNDYTIPVAEQPRIASRLLNNNGVEIGSLNLFRGESRGNAIWTSDFLKNNPDIAFTSDGILLLAFEHEGEESFLNINSFTSEIGLGAINTVGGIIDLGNHPGYVSWLEQSETSREEQPRITISPTNEFFISFNGLVKSTNKYVVIIQGFNSDGSLMDSPFSPHSESTADVNFMNADIATNGKKSIVVWQDGRDDDNWDIYGQIFSSTNTIGSNFKINKNDANGTININPSVDMNSSGEGIVAWVDTRKNNYGDIYCQRFNPSTEPIGDNILVSNGIGTIVDRPEVAVLENGNFMIVWTDSIFSVIGDYAYRAKGRQFNSDGVPLNEPFIIPNKNIVSGYVNISTDGTSYYCSWLDNRLGRDYLDVYVKVIGTVITDVNTNEKKIPNEIKLFQNYPNPFNPSTTINYNIPKIASSHLAKGRTKVGFVTLKVYDILGKEVTTLVNQKQKPGSYKVNFNASTLASGIYFYRLRAKNFVQTKKLILMK
ncbi:MAG: T9SS type A sorting domain-containing protein [Melioribacteraceae bacterium]